MFEEIRVPLLSIDRPLVALPRHLLPARGIAQSLSCARDHRAAQSRFRPNHAKPTTIAHPSRDRLCASRCRDTRSNDLGELAERSRCRTPVCRHRNRRCRWRSLPWRRFPSRHRPWHRQRSASRRSMLSRLAAAHDSRPTPCRHQDVQPSRPATRPRAVRRARSG